MIAFLFSSVVLIVYGQETIYYVDMSGSDSSSCGTQTSPCASINQIISNNPGASFTVSISDGSYPTTSIILLNSSYVIFQGTGNTFINTTFRQGFIVNSLYSGFEFRDLTICLRDDGTNFVTLNSENNSAGSTSRQGGVLILGGYGTANVVVDSSVFINSSAFDAFIEIWTEDVNQQFLIVNSLFSNVNASVPIVYFEIFDCGVINVKNSTWSNIFSRIGCGALEILGSNDGVDHTVYLDGLTFVNCTGSIAGALLVGYNSLLLSNSNFAGNYGQLFGNDVVQGLGDSSSRFTYSITGSYSTSDLPKAVVRNVDSGAITDISYLLPSPTDDPKVLMPQHHSAEGDDAELKKIKKD